MVKRVVARQAPKEHKMVDYSYSVDYNAVPATLGYYQVINGLAQGITGETRIGDKVNMMGFTAGIRMINYMEPGDAEGDYALDVTLRQTKKFFWAVVLEKDPYGSTFDFTKCWEDVKAVPRFRVKEHLRRYRILKQGTLTLDPDSGVDTVEKVISMRFKKPITVQYDPAVATAAENAISKNKIVIFIYRYNSTTMMDEGEVYGFNLNTRSRFTDS